MLWDLTCFGQVRIRFSSVFYWGPHFGHWASAPALQRRPHGSTEGFQSLPLYSRRSGLQRTSPQDVEPMGIRWGGSVHTLPQRENTQQKEYNTKMSIMMSFDRIDWSASSVMARHTPKGLVKTIEDWSHFLLPSMACFEHVLVSYFNLSDLQYVSTCFHQYHPMFLFRPAPQGLFFNIDGASLCDFLGPLYCRSAETTELRRGTLEKIKYIGNWCKLTQPPLIAFQMDPNGTYVPGDLCYRICGCSMAIIGCPCPCNA